MKNTPQNYVFFVCVTLAIIMVFVSKSLTQIEAAKIENLNITLSLTSFLISTYVLFFDDSKDYDKAIDFLTRNSEERLLIPLCGVAAMIDKTHCYERKIYNEFCLQQPGVQQIILKKCGVYSRTKDFRCKSFLERYFKRFKRHCKKSLLGFRTNFPMEHYPDASLQKIKRFKRKIGADDASSISIVLIANETVKMAQQQNLDTTIEQRFNRLANILRIPDEDGGGGDSEERYIYQCCKMRAIASSGHPQFDISKVAELQLTAEDAWLLAWYECYMNL